MLGSAIAWIVVGYFAIVVCNTAWVWWRGPIDPGPGPGDGRHDPADFGPGP